MGLDPYCGRFMVAEVKQALLMASCLCLAFGAFWITRVRVVGRRGFAMSGAFFSMALLCFGYREEWRAPILIAVAVVVLALLAVDFALRAGEKVNAQ